MANSLKYNSYLRARPYVQKKIGVREKLCIGKKSTGIINGLNVLMFTVAAQLIGAANVNAYVLDEGGPYDEESIVDAIAKADVTLEARIRYEDVSVDSTPKQGAQALTLRSRLAIETRRYELFSFGLRFDDIRALPDDKNYFSGSNGQTDDLLVADPELTEISEAWLAYDISNTLIKYGKQDYTLNNGRLLGSNPWRQNSSTFNGLSIRNESLNYTKISFARFTRFEDAFDPDAENTLGAHNPVVKVFNLSYRGVWLNDASLYGLTIDGGRENPTWSTETYGFNFDGKAGDRHLVNLFFDYAVQVDKDNNPVDYKAKYHQVNLGYTFDDWVGARLKFEKLGADGNGFFVTPLASLHDFQGAVDIFSQNGLGNIQGGLKDTELTLFAKHELTADRELSLALNYHQYQSSKETVMRDELGSEWGVTLAYRDDNYTAMFSYADYQAEDYGVDQNKAWLTFECRL